MFSAISNVKKNAIIYENFNKPDTKKRVDYVGIFGDKNIYKNVVELDLRQAYWQTCYLMGLCDKKVYDIFANKSGQYKLARNMAVGSLYSEKNVFECTPDRDEFSYKINRPAPGTYLEVCSRVDLLMKKLYSELNDEFIFYWVDAIFVINKNNVINRSIEIANNWGYELAIKKPCHILQTDKLLNVYNDEGKRTFTKSNRF
jgi:hypothetical protein